MSATTPRRHPISGLRKLALALLFAERKHRGQIRKDGVSPFIRHNLEVAVVLAFAGVREEEVYAVVALHDIAELTTTPLDEMRVLFGDETVGSVIAVTDDMTLDRLERKRRQVMGAARLPPAARLVRLADKIANCFQMPPDWTRDRRERYLDDARQIRAAIRGTHPRLEALFDRVYADRERVLFESVDLLDYLIENAE